MRILFVTNIFQPDFCGGAALITDLAEGIQEAGHDVTVYGAYPYYPEWRDKSGDNGWRIRHEKYQGVTIFRHGMFIPSRPGKLIPRLMYELSFCLSLLRSLFRGPRHDAVIVFCPMFGGVLFAVLRKWLRREPVFLTVQDIPADAASAAGISKSRLFDGFANWLQAFAFNRTDAWSSINPGMVQRLESMKRPDIPVHFFPNWLTGPLADAAEQLQNQPRPDSSGPLQLLYCGNIGKKQGLLAFCKRLADFDLDFHFNIRGQGAAADEVREWIDGNDDPRFEMSGFLDDDKFVAAIHAADWFVITEKAGAGFSFLPSKLIPCMSVGTPVLSICDETGPLGKEVTTYGLGLSISWDDIDQLPEMLQDAESKENRQTIRDASLKRAKTYQRQTAIRNYESALQELARTSEKRPIPGND